MCAARDGSAKLRVTGKAERAKVGYAMRCEQAPGRWRPLNRGRREGLLANRLIPSERRLPAVRQTQTLELEKCRRREKRGK